jgi:hypothetical protein
VNPAEWVPTALEAWLSPVAIGPVARLRQIPWRYPAGASVPYATAIEYAMAIETVATAQEELATQVLAALGEKLVPVAVVRRHATTICIEPAAILRQRC